MPTSARGFRALLTGAALALGLVSVAGTAGATPAAAPTPGATTPAPVEGSPTPTCALACVPSLSPSPAASRTPSPTPSPSATRSATPRPSRSRTAAPRPRATHSAAPAPSEPPVSASVGVGEVQGTPASPAAVRAKDSSSTSGAGDTITRLLLLVLGGALVLGAGGATGLYLTRHGHDE